MLTQATALRHVVVQQFFTLTQIIAWDAETPHPESPIGPALPKYSTKCIELSKLFTTQQTLKQLSSNTERAKKFNKITQDIQPDKYQTTCT